MSKLEAEKGTVLDKDAGGPICNYDPFCERPSDFIAQLRLARDGQPPRVRELECCRVHIDTLRDQVGAHQAPDIKIFLAFGRRPGGPR